MVYFYAGIYNNDWNEVRMVYLDYAANTPVDTEVMDVFCRNSMEFYGNTNANHTAGKTAREEMEKSTSKILEILDAQGMEVIYTSGASEANNLAVKGIARAYREDGRHIISTCLEHSSVSGSLSWLQTMGYEIDLVDIRSDGTIDLDHLKELLRKDTILVSIGYVDAELGVRQPVEEIGKILTNYSDCHLHLDATQAVGKIKLNVNAIGIDLVTFAPHKFYGLNGMGILLRNENVVLEPLIHGGRSNTIYRSGTPVPAQAASIAAALEKCYGNLEYNFKKVETINMKIKNVLKEYPLVNINSTDKSLPHFLNLSVKGIKAEDFQQELNKYEIYVSTKSACSMPNTPSRAVSAITHDKKIARCSWRISLSHLLTESDVDEFLESFKLCYEDMTQSNI